MVERFSTFPALEKLKLFRLILFCFLTGNEDKHLKNFSLLRRGEVLTLAPAYERTGRDQFPVGSQAGKVSADYGRTLYAAAWAVNMRLPGRGYAPPRHDAPGGEYCVGAALAANAFAR